MERHFPGAQPVPHRFQARHLCIRRALFLLCCFARPAGLKLLDFRVNIGHGYITQRVTMGP
jgi:hypothetical protein